MITIRIAFRNVIKHWRQSLAAIVSISAAFITLAVFQGYIRDIEDRFVSIYRHRQMFADVVIENKQFFEPAGRSEPWNYQLTPEMQKFVDDFLEKNKDIVENRVRFLTLSGMMNNGSASIIYSGIGYDLKEGKEVRGDWWKWNALYGKTLDSIDNNKNILVVGQTMASLLGCRPTKKRNFSAMEKKTDEPIPIECQKKSEVQMTSTTASGKLNAIDADVVGMIDGGFKDLDSKYINMPLPLAQMLLDTSNISYVTVLLKSEKYISEFIQRIKKANSETQWPLLFQTWKEHKIFGDTYQRSMEMMFIFKTFVIIIILTIATLSVFNTLIKVIKERTKEIGTLRSIGYKRYQIAQIFIAEAAGLAFIGNIVGAIVSILFSVAINSMGIMYKAGLFVEPVPLAVTIDAMIYTYGFIFLMILSGIAALVAIQTTLRQKISENLSYA